MVRAIVILAGGREFDQGYVCNHLAKKKKKTKSLQNIPLQNPIYNLIMNFKYIYPQTQLINLKIYIYKIWKFYKSNIYDYISDLKIHIIIIGLTIQEHNSVLKKFYSKIHKTLTCNTYLHLLLTCIN